MNLKPLIEILAREQKVHEKLWQAKRDERKLLVLADAANLLKNTEAISDLATQARSLEAQRIDLTLQAAFELGITKTDVTLKDILQAIPPANRIELEKAGQTLKRTLEGIRDTNQTNHMLLQRSVSIISEDLKQFTPQKESGVYTARGTKDRSAAQRAGLNIRA